MKMTAECVFCVLRLMDRNYMEVQKDPAKRMAFMRRICTVVANANEDAPPPAINGEIMAMIAAETGKGDLFAQEKHTYNQTILKMRDEIWEHIAQADDKLYRALQYAMAGNYIDFGVASNVDEEKMHGLIEEATQIDLGGTYETFREDLKNAKTMTYLLDNCGEIVFDKMCIAEIKALYPDLKITAVVRGLPTYNDVTMTDAQDVGLTDIVPVIGNGMGIPGTMLEQISEEAKRAIDESDIIIAKGMGNYETMEGCGLNVYYLFLCKCERFMREFDLPHLSSVFTSEKDHKARRV